MKLSNIFIIFALMTTSSSLMPTATLSRPAQAQATHNNNGKTPSSSQAQQPQRPHKPGTTYADLSTKPPVQEPDSVTACYQANALAQSKRNGLSTLETLTALEGTGKSKVPTHKGNNLPPVNQHPLHQPEMHTPPLQPTNFTQDETQKDAIQLSIVTPGNSNGNGNGNGFDARHVVIAVYFLCQFDSIKEMISDAADKLRLYRARDVLQRFIPSCIIDHPNRGMLLSLLAGAVGTFCCSRYYQWTDGQQPGTYNWINILLSGIAGHFSYSCVKMLFIRPEYTASFYRWIEDLAQTHYAARKNYPPIIPIKK